MIIRDKILQEILNNPLFFSEVLKLYNQSKGLKLQPATLLRRLQRRSESVRTSVVIADYYRAKGYSESQIFENGK